MSLVKGPFEIKYGLDVLAGIESLDLEYEIDTDTFDTIQGRSYEVTKSKRVSVVATFLETDVASLSVVLPQYHVPNGGTLSTGETVNDADGAIDVTPDTCTDAADTTDVVITSCGNPGSVLRIPECETEIEDIEMDTVRKVAVKFRGLSEDSIAQFFAEGAVSIVS